TRDFVHVKDIAQGYERFLDSSMSSSNVFNIGSGVITSVNDLADIIDDLMGELYDREVEIEHVEPPEWRDEAKEEFDYSIEKINEELDYEPQYSLREGIENILRDF
ncbi:MAG: NAD-dependent epimerase/dehydratase family protein, partial [Candidatus Aenigmatarchaeota archaeon]